MDKKKLAKKIKLARIEKDLKQVELAELIESKQKSISCYENGIMVPSIETLLKLAEVLEKPLSYFLDELKSGLPK